MVGGVTLAMQPRVVSQEDEEREEEKTYSYTLHEEETTHEDDDDVYAAASIRLPAHLRKILSSYISFCLLQQ